MEQSQNSRVKIGLASVHGTPDEISESDASRRLVEKIVADIGDVYRLPPKLLLLLTTPQWSLSAPGLPAEIRRQIKKATRVDVPLLGGSMARLYCSADPNPDIEAGLAVAVLCSNDFRITVDYIREVSENAEERIISFKDLARKIERASTVDPGLGSSADKDLLAFMPGYLRNRKANYDHDIFGELMDAFGKKYALFGASPANQMRATSGFQYANDETLQSGLAVGLMEYDIRIGSALAHGFAPVRDDRISVNEVVGSGPTSHGVQTLNGEPASTFLRRLRDRHNPVLGFPILGLPAGADYDLIIPLADWEECTEAVFLNRSVRKGDSLYVMGAEPDQMKAASKKALAEAVRLASVAESDPALLIAFPCATRYTHYEKLGFNWAHVVGDVLGSPPQIPIIGGLSAGEFGKDEWRQFRSNNLAVWVAVIGSGHNRRGQNRRYSEMLRSAALRVFRGSTTSEVMRLALTEAIAAGASGGDVCVVDRTERKILGDRFGDFLPADGTTQNWALAHKETNCRVPNAPATRGLPLDLQRYAGTIEFSGSETPPAFAAEYSGDVEDDALSVIVHTLCAIWIPNTLAGIFPGDKRLAERCNIQSYLAVPLPGKGDEAGATLRIGFEKPLNVDREWISLWHSYGQKVGQSLERAAEVEDRVTIEKLNATVGTICARDISRDWTSVTEVEELLATIKERLEADYVFARVRLDRTSDDFHLVTLHDRVSDLHRSMRPIVKRGHGSCDPSISRSGRFWRSAAELQKNNRMLKGDHAIGSEVSADVSQAWADELKHYRSQGTLPIWLSGEYEGSLVIISKRDYFFHERRERLALSAAMALETLLENRRNVWLNRFRSDQQRRLDAGKRNLVQYLVDAVSREHEEWNAVLAHITEVFVAEFAGLFLIKGRATNTTPSYAYPPDSPNKSQFDKVPDRFDRFARQAQPIEVYSVERHYEPGHWLLGLNNALVVRIDGADGAPLGALMLANRRNDGSPFDFDDDAEQRAAIDIANSIGAAALSRFNRLQLDQAFKLGAAGLLGTLVVHNINTRLGTIQGRIDLLRRSPSEQEFREAVDALEHERIEMRNIVRHLTNRPVAGRQKESLRNLVKLALNIARPKAAKTQLTSDFRDARQDGVFVDVWQIVLGVVNVLDNAIEAAGPAGKVVIVTYVEGTKGVIRIWNSGPPPPPEIYERMFRAGFSSKDQHLGLGLALTAHAFDSAGGGVSTNLPDNGGFEVIMMIPLLQEGDGET